MGTTTNTDERPAKARTHMTLQIGVKWKYNVHIHYRFNIKLRVKQFYRFRSPTYFQIEHKDSRWHIWGALLIRDVSL
jgi:hypothetical protein